MESDLYKIQQQNFLTVLTYYNKTKEKTENYCLFIKKYKKYTQEYLSKIKNIFLDYSSSLYEEVYDFSDDNIIDNDSEDNGEDSEDINTNKSIFDLNLNRNDNNNKINITNINNNSLIIKNDVLKSNNIIVELSPIFKLTNIIFKQIKNQINGLKLFLKGIDTSLGNFEKNIENTKKEINILKNNYLDIKQNFFQSLSAYKKENEILINNYSKIESKIAQFSFLKSNEEIYVNNKNALNINIKNLENDLNLKIFDIKAKENDFIKKDNEKYNFRVNFEKSSEKCIQGIIENTLLLIQNLKENIEKFLSYFANCYHMNYNDISKDIKKVQEMKNYNEYQDIINHDLKEINVEMIENFNIKYNPIHYDINILKNKNINQKLFDKLIKNGYDIKPENFELNEKDIYFIVKKMYNFSLVNKENYDIEKENKKIFISNIIDLMLTVKKDEKKFLDKNPNLTEEKLSKLYNFLNSSESCRISFLEKLGNKRSEGILEFPNYLYDIIIKIFFLISDTFSKEKNLDIIIQILILSQTFYRIEKEEKIYLCHDVSKHEIFQKDDFWNDYIKNIIIMEIKKREENEKSIGKKLDENDSNKRNNEIVFAQILTMSECMKNFELNEEKIINIFTPIFDIYQTPQNTRDSILNYINQK